MASLQRHPPNQPQLPLAHQMGEGSRVRVRLQPVLATSVSIHAHPPSAVAPSLLRRTGPWLLSPLQRLQMLTLNAHHPPSPPLAHRMGEGSRVRVPLQCFNPSTVHRLKLLHPKSVSIRVHPWLRPPTPTPSPAWPPSPPPNTIAPVRPKPPASASASKPSTPKSPAADSKPITTPRPAPSSCPSLNPGPSPSTARNSCTK